jgi:serine protease 22
MIPRRLASILWVACLGSLASGVHADGLRGDGRRLNFFSDTVDFLFGRWMKSRDALSIDDVRDKMNMLASDETTLAAESDNETSENVSFGEAVFFEPQQLKDLGKIPKIVGGSDADPGEAPWFVMMLTWNKFVPQWEFSGCSGVLVSDRHVLTAGHCVEGKNPADEGIYVHAYQPFWGNPGLNFHFSRVKSYNLNPNFDNGPNWSDTAIIEMMNPLKLDEFETVTLADPAMEINDDDMVDVYGFGRLAEAGNSDVKTLQKVSLPYISGPVCEQFYDSGDVLEDMCCAGFDEGGSDACLGDSGGPMVKQVNGTSVVFGVVSWGDGCGRKGKPGVYTSIQYHYDWIRKTVCNDPGVDESTPLCLPDASSFPSASPSLDPSTSPSLGTSTSPSMVPSGAPSSSSNTETTRDSSTAVTTPSDPSPIVSPSSMPSTLPSTLPSILPSTLPSTLPSSAPSSTSDGISRNSSEEGGQVGVEDSGKKRKKKGGGK